MWVRAVGWVDSVGSIGELDECGTSILEPFDLAIEVVQMTMQEVSRVLATPFAVVFQLDDRPDLGERQTGRLGVANEPETIECGTVVRPVTGRRPLGGWQQAQRFVVPNRFRRHVGLRREFPDSHRHPF